MLDKTFFALIIGSLTIDQGCAMDSEEIHLFEKITRPIPFVIINDSDKITFSQYDYPVEKNGDRGILTNIRFRLLPGAITGDHSRFVEWMNYNSPYNPSISLPSEKGVTETHIMLKAPTTITLSSNRQYNIKDHLNKNFFPDDISITDDIENSHLLTVIYSFDAPEKLRSLPSGSVVGSKYCYSRTFTLDENISSIQNILLSFNGFERGIDKPDLSVMINEKRTVVSGYTQDYSPTDLIESKVHTGTVAWAGELSLVFRAECYRNERDKEKFTEENFITFLKIQLKNKNTLNYAPQLESIEASVTALDLF